MLSNYDFASFQRPAGRTMLVEGIQLLAQIAEDTYFENLTACFEEQKITDTRMRLRIGQLYFSQTGYGRLEVHSARRQHAEVTFHRPWRNLREIRHQARNEQPIAQIVSGYIAALFSTTYGYTTRSYQVREVADLDETGGGILFEVVMK